MGAEFVEQMRRIDPAQNYACDLLMDTNVALEFFSVGDLLRAGDEAESIEAARSSTRYRYRQARARHAIVLVWWLSQQKRNAGILGNEVVDQLETKLAPKPLPGGDGTSFALTSAIMHVVCEYVTGWPVGALTDVDHLAKGTRADDELLRIARGNGKPIVTNEELTESGVVPNPKKLRSRAKAEGLLVYTPQEYLFQNGVNISEECLKFVASLRNGVSAARASNVFDGHDVLDMLVPLYRMILLDHVDDTIAHIEPPGPL